jgi:ABC-type multidrug transport system fused ATPase/permease subunit
MTGDRKWFFSLTPLSHKEYVTFGDDKKCKVLGTGVIKVNDCFSLNDVALVDRLRYNMLSISQLVVADLDVFFANRIRMFLILLANMFVASLALEELFRLISLLLNLP